MPQWIVDLVGESLAPIVWVAIVAIAVCVLAMLIIILAKKAFGGVAGNGPNGRGPRLAVMDVARIDDKRRLILIRRDKVEHLVLVGGQNDVLLEASISRASSSPTMRPDEPGQGVSARDVVRSDRSFGGGMAPVPDSETGGDAPRAAPNEKPRESPARSAPAVAAAPPAPPMSTESKSAGSTDEAHPVPTPAIDRSRSEPARVAAQRSMATPTLDVRPSSPRSDAAPASPSRPDAAPDLPRTSAPVSARREPTVVVPDVRPEPMGAGADRPRADLRAQMNRSQSPAIEKVQDATAPAIAVDTADRRDKPRQPLSVRSFATAIQSRNSPPEMPQPDQRAAAQPSSTRTREAGAETLARVGQPVAAPPSPYRDVDLTPKRPTVADAEPSLEDFLSAEIDSSFGNDAFFTKAPSPQMDTPRLDTAERPAQTTKAGSSPRTATPSTSTSEPDPALSNDRGAGPPPSGSTSQAGPAAEQLTLEEEMERLLGDFNFGDENDHKPNRSTEPSV